MKSKEHLVEVSPNKSLHLQSRQSASGRKQSLELSGEWLVCPRKQPLAKIELK